MKQLAARAQGVASRLPNAPGARRSLSSWRQSFLGFSDVAKLWIYRNARRLHTPTTKRTTAGGAEITERLLDFYFPDCSSPLDLPRIAARYEAHSEAELARRSPGSPSGGRECSTPSTRRIFDNNAKPNQRKRSLRPEGPRQAGRGSADTHIVFPPTVFPVSSVKCMRRPRGATTRTSSVPYATAAFQGILNDDPRVYRARGTWPKSLSAPASIASASSPPSRPIPKAHGCAPTRTN